MNLVVVALGALALGAILGLTLGVPLGRRVERVAWYAESAISRARLTGWLIRDLTGSLLAAAGIVVVVAFIVWALLTYRT